MSEEIVYMNLLNDDIRDLGKMIAYVRKTMTYGEVAACSYRTNLDGHCIDGVYWRPEYQWFVKSLYDLVCTYRHHRAISRYITPQLDQVWDLYQERIVDLKAVEALLVQIEEIITDPATEQDWLSRPIR